MNIRSLFKEQQSLGALEQAHASCMTRVHDHAQRCDA